MQPQEDVFLIDHAWTTTPKQAKEQLAAHPQLLQRIEDILDLAPETEDQKTRIENVVDTMWYNAKSYRVTDPNGGEILVWCKPSTGLICLVLIFYTRPYGRVGFPYQSQR